jgi:predicted DsbA family dithiol-disulfide isomerase
MNMNTLNTSTEPLTIDVVSDIVCPWCYIGKRRLELALAMRPDMPVEVRWRPFFLNPWVPREGIDRDQYLETKFGSVDAYKSIAKRVKAAAAQEGLVYALDKIARQPNTIDAHRLIRWAHERGDPAKMKQRLMELYFRDGADLTDREVLVQAARESGLDPEEVRRDLASERDVAEVEAEAARANQAGINGVPYFIFGNKLGVSGAQSPEVLAGAIDKAREVVSA